MKICYEPKEFRPGTLDVIARAEAICREYEAQGFSISLRQLYYQFVARGLLPNKQTEYKRLGQIVGDARLAGLLDWRWLEDRGRHVAELTHWTSPSSILDAVADQYRTDRWARQPYRPIVLIEKDALSGVFEPVCNRLDVPLLACKGYTSLSTFWQLGHVRLRGYLRAGQTPVILHFGDHDPSGIDMTRDIRDRLSLFLRKEAEVRRLALNFDQVQRYNPPPNPAKDTDSRYVGYVDQFGDESWELDALDPTMLATLVIDAVLGLRDDSLWDEAEEEDAEARRKLRALSERWEDVIDWLEDE